MKTYIQTLNEAKGLSNSNGFDMAETAVLFLQKKRSKRKLGRALLCLLFALQKGFGVSSGDT